MYPSSFDSHINRVYSALQGVIAMGQPQFIVLLCIIFVVLGIFNFITGRRRMHQTYTQGILPPWYKRLHVLIGIEYGLIGLAFLMNISINYHWLPASLASSALPFYVVVLLASGLLAGVVIYQSITTARRRRTQPTQTARTQGTSLDKTRNMTAEERAVHAERLRERRQKAAAARRRRAGKA
jgi:hypothetical protein